MPWRRTVASGATIAIGTDIGAGDEWLIPRVLNDCYKVHMSEHGDRARPSARRSCSSSALSRALGRSTRSGSSATWMPARMRTS